MHCDNNVPYSPILNAKEWAWNLVKADVKKDVALAMPIILESEITTYSSYRVERLIEIINNKHSFITPQLRRTLRQH